MFEKTVEALKVWISQSKVQAVLISLVSVVVIMLGLTALKYDAERYSDDFISKLNIQDPMLRPPLAAAPATPAELSGRLTQQLAEIRAREDFHLTILRFYTVRYYAAISLASLLGLTAATALFFISKSGWSAADDRLIAVFIICAAGATYFSTFPTVFRQQDNIAENTALFLQYRDLEGDVLSYAATGRSPSLPAPAPDAVQSADDRTRQFILQVDSQMKVLHKFALGMDYTKIPKTIEIPDSSQFPGNPNANQPKKTAP